MKKDNPLVSIIIPVYNGEDYVKEAIDSALNQTYKNIEVIVVNDGSKDNTEKICLKYKDRIKYYSKANGGVSTALNLAISKSNGEYISWLSHDDLYYPNKIEEQIKFANDNTIVMSDYDLINEKSDIICNIVLSNSRINNSLSIPLMKGYINGITLLLPKKAFIKCGEFNPELKCTQDYDMWFRMIKNDYKFFHVPVSLAMSRQHQNQTTNTSPRMLTEGNILWKNMINELPEEMIYNDFKTKYSFYKEMADFLKNSPYDEAYCYVLDLLKREDKKLDVSNIKVSVIIPFYDESIDVLSRSVNSVLNQSHKNIEVILINDNPLKYNKSELKKILNDKRVKYYENKENLGVSLSRNFGIKVSTGDYISFLDADDEFMDNKVLYQLAEMEKMKSVFSHTSYIIVDEKGKEKMMDSGKQNGDILKEAIISCRIATPSVMLKKDIISLNNYRFNEKIGIGEDTCFWLSILVDYDILGIDVPFVKVHIDSFSAAYNKDKQYIGLKNILSFVLSNDRINSYSKETSILARNFSNVLLNDNIYNNELNDILNSKSWKITRPLRLISKTVSSFKKNGFKSTINLIKRYLCKK